MKQHYNHNQRFFFLHYFPKQTNTVITQNTKYFSISILRTKIQSEVPSSEIHQVKIIFLFVILANKRDNNSKKSNIFQFQS